MFTFSARWLRAGAKRKRLAESAEPFEQVLSLPGPGGEGQHEVVPLEAVGDLVRQGRILGGRSHFQVLALFALLQREREHEGGLAGAVLLPGNLELGVAREALLALLV